MLRGRKIQGLPVFSWHEGAFLGRADQCYLDLNSRSLGGIVMEKRRFTKNRGYIPKKAVLKIYRDGIIITAKEDMLLRPSLPKGTILYSIFLQYMEMPLQEGQVVSDLFFDDQYRILGGEVSAGFWNDVVQGRSFCSWKELLENIQRL